MESIFMECWPKLAPKDKHMGWVKTLQRRHCMTSTFRQRNSVKAIPPSRDHTITPVRGGAGWGGPPWQWHVHDSMRLSRLTAMLGLKKEKFWQIGQQFHHRGRDPDREWKRNLGWTNQRNWTAQPRGHCEHKFAQVNSSLVKKTEEANQGPVSTTGTGSESWVPRDRFRVPKILCSIW